MDQLQVSIRAEVSLLQTTVYEVSFYRDLVHQNISSTVPNIMYPYCANNEVNPQRLVNPDILLPTVSNALTIRQEEN